MQPEFLFSASRQIKTLKIHPQGESFVNLTRNLKIGGFCDFQLHPLHIGRGVVRVDVSFSSFLCAKAKGQFGVLGGIPLNI